MNGDIMRDLDSGRWAEINPVRCPCRGSGWLLSDFDTFHACPVHGNGVPHPEDEDMVFDYEAHMLKVRRAAYATFRNTAMRHNVDRVQFRKLVEARVASERRPQDWVNAAEEVAEDLSMMAAEEEAHRLGYSCRLEMSWALDAADERDGYYW